MLDQATRKKLELALGPPTDLDKFGESLGVVDVQKRELSVYGMVLPKGSGYQIVLNSKEEWRERFSWAHELGHIIDQSGLLAEPQFRSAPRRHNEIEELCDEIAAEILMPREQFTEYMQRCEGTLAAVPKLAQIFDTSIRSTAIRYTELLPYPAVLSVWKRDAEQLKFSWRRANNRCRPYSFGIPKGARAQEAGRPGPHIAHQSTGLIRTEEPLLVTRRYRGSESHNWVKYPTESMGFGSYGNRFVLSLSYVTIPGKGKTGREGPST